MGSRWGLKAGLWAGWLLAAVAAAVPVQAAPKARILHFEPLHSITPDRDTVLRKATDPQLRELRFHAFNRQFELSLDANRALIAQLGEKTGPASMKLYRGQLKGVAGSWVRLTAKGRSLQGMFWDGADVYVIEPAAQVRDSLVAPLDASDETVIFRLADVLIDSETATCATEPEVKARTGSQQFDALVRELKAAPVVMQAAGANVRLKISAMGDAAFLQRYANEADARDAILARLNNVDGIFSSQLGVEIQIPAMFINAADSDPLSNATAPNALLQELATLRKRSPELHSAGLTHLFTGRDLNGETVGIAYLNRLCHAEYGAGLTEARTYNVWRDSLVAAHEIGHNFGASHDGDSQGVCPATATGAYLMSPSVSGSDRFSQCSLDSMRPRVHTASCITALADADLSIPADLGETRASVSRPFEWRLEVTNVGGVAAERVRAEILVPPTVLIDDAYVIGGSCTSGAGLIFCQLGDLSGSATRAVNLTLRSDTAASNSISARIASDEDAVLSNNRGDGALLIGHEADVSVQMQGPTSAPIGGEFELAFAVVNLATNEVADLSFALELPPGLAASAAALAGGSCATTALGVQCTLTSLPGETTASGSVTVTASISGHHTVQARVAGAYIDPEPSNDDAEHVIDIEPISPAAVQNSPSNTSERGGGAGSWSLLLALAALNLARRRAGGASFGL